MEQKRLFLLDAYALIFRAYYALLRNPRFTSTGINTSAIFGFVNTLQELLKHQSPSHIAVCFDPGGKTFRHEAYAQYKANRSATPEGILVAVPYIKEILKAYNIKVLQVDGYEADDVIGSMTKLAYAHGFDTYMVTGDKDLGQLVNDRTRIFHPGKNEVLGVKEIDELYGLQSPVQVIDLLGLMGDTADNIPGCPGVGPKTAEKLIQQYGSIENLLEHTGELKGSLKKKIEDNREQIVFSKFLATIKTDVPLDWDEEALRRVPVDYVALRKVFAELEFKTLTTRIIDHGEANVGLDGVPLPAAPAGSQPSLFGSEAPAPVEVTPAATIKSHEHDYRLIADLDEARAYVAGLMQGQGDIGLHIVAQGQEAMRAHIPGLCPVWRALPCGLLAARRLRVDDRRGEAPALGQPPPGEQRREARHGDAACPRRGLERTLLRHGRGPLPAAARAQSRHGQHCRHARWLCRHEPRRLPGAQGARPEAAEPAQAREALAGGLRAGRPVPVAAPGARPAARPRGHDPLAHRY
jgi:DNA polymerase-1